MRRARMDGIEVDRLFGKVRVDQGMPFPGIGFVAQRDVTLGGGVGSRHEWLFSKDVRRTACRREDSRPSTASNRSIRLR